MCICTHNTFRCVSIHSTDSYGYLYTRQIHKCFYISIHTMNSHCYPYTRQIRIDYLYTQSLHLCIYTHDRFICVSVHTIDSYVYVYAQHIHMCIYTHDRFIWLSIRTTDSYVYVYTRPIRMCICTHDTFILLSIPHSKCTARKASWNIEGVEPGTRKDLADRTCGGSGANLK